jgi:hypothetical protein
MLAPPREKEVRSPSEPMLPTLVNPWAEAVFHVLAHVGATAALPSSLHNTEWIDYAARRVGVAETRSLGEDAAVLGKTLNTDRSLAQAQLLAWLFESMDRVHAVQRRSLVDLDPSDVDRPAVLESLRVSNSAAVEVLRAAAELEVDRLADIAVEPIDGPKLESTLDRLVPVAPELARCTVGLARPLGIRGRLYDHIIWVGVPNDALGVSVEHVSMQAAHEATVCEVVGDGFSGYVAVEREAVRRLTERAREHGLSEMHQRWLRRFRVP